MMDQNTCFAYLNMELPDDIRRLKEAGYYDAAIARIDACLAEDWTASQNQPLHPQGALPVNPTPHGVDAWRQGLLAHREILRRLPRDYTLTADQLLNKLQATLRDFTAEEFAALDAAGQMDWRFVEGQKRYIYRAAETLVATHPDLAARQLDPPVPERSWDRFEPQHDQMVRTGAASADITLRTSIGMTDETFARALAAAKAKGRNTVHVKVWLPQSPAVTMPFSGTEQYHAGQLYRPAYLYCAGNRTPAHRVLGGRPCRELPLWGTVQLPQHCALRCPAGNAGRPGAAGF